MSVSRSPSPAEGFVSAQSKLQAMLAQAGSDDDDNGSVVSTPAGSPQKKQTTGPPAMDQDDDDDDDDIVRPRGRIAAQMMAESALEAQEESDDGDDDGPASTRRLHRREARQSTPENESPAPERQPSPGLFVSPNPSPAKQSLPLPVSNDSDDENDLLTIRNERFAALVMKKRQERIAREAEEARLKAEKLALRSSQLHASSDDESLDDGGITDDDGGHRLTQETTGQRLGRQRVASKKALEEMNRETQRMQRDMQLAHEPRTRKKISKATLFDRFNFRLGKDEAGVAAVARGSSPAASPEEKRGKDDDGEDVEMRDTPPTSPPLGQNPDVPAKADSSLASAPEGTGKGKEVEANKAETEALAQDARPPSPAKPKRRVRVVMPALPANSITLDSDDDGEITIRPTTKLDAVFDRVPQKKSHEDWSLQLLRRLAHQTSPSKRNRNRQGGAAAKSISSVELQQLLAQRVREQARQEREQHVEMLRVKGIVVQTDQERESEKRWLQDLVERKRKQLEEMMAREREEGRQERKEQRENGNVDPLAWDDSEDEEYEGEDPVEIELSGSEEGDEGDEDEADEDEGGEDEGDEEDEEDGVEGNSKDRPVNGLFLDAADDADSEGDAPASDEADTMEMADTPIKRHARKHRRRQAVKAILSDAEDEDEPEAEQPVIAATPLVAATPAPKSKIGSILLSTSASKTSPAPPTGLRSAKKTFIPGLAVTSPGALGLTQMFACTMDGSQDPTQMDVDDTPTRPTPSAMPDFDVFPDPSVSDGEDDPIPPTADAMALDSQSIETQGLDTQGGRVNLAFQQSQMHNLDSIPLWGPSTQMTDMMVATQDGGLADYSPLGQRFLSMPSSTAATVPNDLDDDNAPTSPLVRRGRLLRKADLVASSAKQQQQHITQPTAPLVASEEADGAGPGDPFGFGTTDAFDKLQKATRREEKKLARMKCTKRRAQNMVEEQAEESEDEYAGLGGADGEDSSDDDGASIHGMIDDEGGEDVNELELAALVAKNKLAQDQAEVDKLFHDITSGMMRRGKHDHGSLSDPEEDEEARRRKKRRQFAKMQRTLFADERVKKMAEKASNFAFLRTLEDRDYDDDDGGMDWMGVPDTQKPREKDSQEDSQDGSGTPFIVPNSQPTGQIPSKRDRRRPIGQKPATLGEIRESLSSLLEEPSGSIIPATDPATDEVEVDDDNRDENNRWTKPRPSGVIDRISFKRSASTASSRGRMAFASSSGSTSTFKVPALLRRATTNSSTLSSSSGTNASGGFTVEMQNNSNNTASAGFGDEGKIKRSAGKRSGVSGMLSAAREQERRAAVDAGEKRREQRKVKGAEMRGKAVDGLFGAGRFE